MRAVRPIEVHEALTISYLDPYTPRWQRRAVLQHNYFFDIDATMAAADEHPTRYDALAPPVYIHQLRVCGEDVDVVVHESAEPPWRHDARDVAMAGVVGCVGGVWWEGRPALTHPVFSGPEEEGSGGLHGLLELVHSSCFDRAT